MQGTDGFQTFGGGGSESKQAKEFKEPIFESLSQHLGTHNYKLWVKTIALVAPQNHQQKHISLNVKEAF